MPIRVNDSGTIKTSKNCKVKVGGVWKQVKKALCKDNGEWKQGWIGKTFIMGNSTAYIGVGGASSVKLINTVYKMYSPTGELIFTSEPSDRIITYSSTVISVKEGNIVIVLTSDRGMQVAFNMTAGYTSYKWSFEFDELIIS